MKSMSMPRYEDGGRTAQKSRTRAALVAAARDLVAAGVDATVEQAAEAAGVSRTTAYRYFPTKRDLLVAAHPEVVATSMLPSDAPADDAAARLDAGVANFTAMIVDTEAQQRTMLRLSLEPTPPSEALPLRQGRAIGWLTEALEPLRGERSEEEVAQLVRAVRATTGIEALVWLVDIAGLSRADAVALMRWSAGALLERARHDPPPGATPPARRAASGRSRRASEA
jgi:AcrR family transcriptional regulator